MTNFILLSNIFVKVLNNSVRQGKISERKRHRVIVCNMIIPQNQN